MNENLPNIIIRCDISSLTFLSHFGIKIGKWKSILNTRNDELCAAIRDVLVGHISKQRGFQDFSQQHVEVRTVHVKAPPKPPRIPNALLSEHFENPKSIDRNRYWLTRTQRLGAQFGAVCDAVRGSGICFAFDTLADAYGQRRR